MNYMTSDRMVGPLVNLNPEPFYIKDFQDIPQVTIGLIGDTYAGKTNYAKTVAHSLGGVYQETVNFSNRTLTDGVFLFGQSQGSPLAIKLKSHAGHDIGMGREGPKGDYNVVVMKHLKSMTFSKQMRIVEPIMRTEGIDPAETYALITRATSEDELTTRRLNTIKRAGFKEMYFIDNPKRKEYSAETLNPENVDLILAVLHSQYPDLQLINFAEEYPDSLEGRVVAFDSQIETLPIPEGGLVHHEDEEVNDIYESMQKNPVLF